MFLQKYYTNVKNNTRETLSSCLGWEIRKAAMNWISDQFWKADCIIHLLAFPFFISGFRSTFQHQSRLNFENRLDVRTSLSLTESLLNWWLNVFFNSLHETSLPPLLNTHRQYTLLFSAYLYDNDSFRW